jgi:hypothetical protein
MFNPLRSLAKERPEKRITRPPVGSSKRSVYYVFVELDHLGVGDGKRKKWRSGEWGVKGVDWNWRVV